MTSPTQGPPETPVPPDEPPIPHDPIPPPPGDPPPTPNEPAIVDPRYTVPGPLRGPDVLES